MKKIYKLQSIGGSYYIALPKDWLKRYNLGKGSHIEISIETDGSLKIRPAEVPYTDVGKEPESIVTMDVKDKDTIYTLLISLYLEGYDIIVLRSSDSSTLSAVRNTVSRVKNLLLGFEIMDEDSSSIVLRVLISSDTDIPTIIKNMNRIARSMYLDVVSSLADKDIAKAYEIEARDQDLNRLYFYITRAIRKKVATNIEPRENLRLLDLRMMAKSIEEIGDEAKKSAKTVQDILINEYDIEPGYVDKISRYVAELDDIHRIVINSLDKSISLTDLVEILHRCDKLREEISNLVLELSSGESKGGMKLSRIASAYEAIASHIYDIASLLPTTI